jgi:glucose/arabinose dehydrogenase/cytochrome c5
LALFGLVTTPTALAQVEAEAYAGVTESRILFRENCAVCHGENLEGAPQGSPLRGPLRHGEAVAEIVAGINDGFADTAMPAWRTAFSADQIRGLALYILETRSDLNYVTSNFDGPLTIPEGVFNTERHRFRLETLVNDLDPLPFSIAPLPDGRLLVTEKTRGIRIVSGDGAKSGLIAGTPHAYDDIYRAEARLDLERGKGWLLDVALHPNFDDNGWIYLSFTDRCEGCNAASRDSQEPVSMTKLVRGRIAGDRWIDEETIWQADLAHYTITDDLVAGGRIAFDDRGHVFLSVGAKGPAIHEGVQDLATPWGKIHRLNDDGSIPADNPFADRSGVYRSIYTFGHRSPQGLEFDPATGNLWQSEHGPRGGDEINLLLPGENYGWPLYSLGMNYEGTPVDFGKELGISFDLSAIQQPVVDMTPSPAISSFIIATSAQFPGWHEDFLVGSLKARSLFRVEIEDNRFVRRETLFEGVGRIRDIAQGVDGAIYLLFEHGAGGQIVQLLPVD